MPTLRIMRATPTPTGAGRAFSLVETMVVVVIVAALMSVVLVSLGGSRNAAQSGACLSNLRQITGGLRQHAIDNQVMPDPAASGVSWAQSIQRYIGGTSVLTCSADTEVAPLTGISYDWRDTGEPATTMAGRKADSTNRTSAVLAFESLPGWHVAKKLNVGLLDGSTQTMDEAACFKDLAAPLRSISPP